MLKVLTRQNHLEPAYEEMLRGRAKVFEGRMNWNVKVRDGKEYDWYDQTEDPTYIVSFDNADRVVGSLRVLPGTGPTMLAHEFRSTFRETINIDCPTTWECTRFCVHPAIDGTLAPSPNVAGQLLSGLCDLALSSGIENIIGVYEPPMERIYRRLGWSPTLLAMSWPWLGTICCGTWKVSIDTAEHLRRRFTDNGFPAPQAHSILCNGASL